MEYQFENLGADRFQHFCQALLLAEGPDVQCLPVGQRDGGRDAFSLYYIDKTRPLTIFQVKYVKRPDAEQAPWKWLVNTMKKELPKIQNYVPKGATRYVLMTNVRGTAHPESGSLDTMNALLEDKLAIPAACLWRDDLNRRLDNQPDLRWAYSELITSSDLLKILVESGLAERKELRIAAIAYST